jgi:hypothetical protein
VPRRCARRPRRRGSSSARSATSRTGTLERLDALRGAYTDLYTEAEALAHSSIAAARTAPAASNGQLPGAARWLIARVPVHYKRRVPPHLRAREIRTLRNA